MDDKETALAKQHYLTIGMPPSTSTDTAAK
jgi:hypothetical protein